MPAALSCITLGEHSFLDTRFPLKQSGAENCVFPMVATSEARQAHLGCLHLQFGTLKICDCCIQLAGKEPVKNFQDQVYLQQNLIHKLVAYDHFLDAAKDMCYLGSCSDPVPIGDFAALVSSIRFTAAAQQQPGQALPALCRWPERMQATLEDLGSAVWIETNRGGFQ